LRRSAYRYGKTTVKKEGIILKDKEVIMKEIIQTIAKSLVDYPDDVIVTERKEGNTIF
jgi:hypothetical protein